MDYLIYIELGFTRTDMNDSVEFDQTGYGGFSLEKVFKKGLSIVANSMELDKPRLYIKKKNSDTYHILQISEECVFDLCHHNAKS